MKKTSIILLVSILILGIFLTGCSQTVVKYQCQDGSFKESAELCSEVSCQTNCPELDCNACPAKIEYETKEVEKKVYVDKPVYKYQCFDGNTKENIDDCENIKSYIDSQDNKASESFCAKTKNKNYEQISIKNAFEENQYMDKSNLYKYYPSLNEGWIYHYPIYIENAGCTKLVMDKFTSKSSVYLNNKLVHSFESEIYSLLVDYMYPEDEQMYNIALADYDDFNEDGTVLLMGMDQGPIKITSSGNYIIRVSIYYDNSKIADIEDTLAVN